jgi:hypothetical protein
MRFCEVGRTDGPQLNHRRIKGLTLQQREARETGPARARISRADTRLHIPLDKALAALTPRRYDVIRYTT